MCCYGSMYSLDSLPISFLASLLTEVCSTPLLLLSLNWNCSTQQFLCYTAKLLKTAVPLRNSSTGWKSQTLLRFVVGGCLPCMHVPADSWSGLPLIFLFVPVEPGTEGWSQWCGTAGGSWWCPEIWQAKWSSRCLGSCSPAGVTRGRPKHFTNTTSAMAFWCGE